MQADFETTPRRDDRRYGVYYHIGFWGTGAHILQGSKPYRIRREFDKVIAKGDTEYAIINVCNVREHVLGIQAATEIMTDRESWSEPAFWDRFAPRTLHEDYDELLANLVSIDEDRMMQDGALFASAKKMLTAYARGTGKSGVLSPGTIGERKRQLADSIQRLDALAARYPADELTPRERPFYDVHLLTPNQDVARATRLLHRGDRSRRESHAAEGRGSSAGTPPRNPHGSRSREMEELVPRRQESKRARLPAKNARSRSETRIAVGCVLTHHHLRQRR